MSSRSTVDKFPLSPADADVARRDPALPGLATVLSPDALLDRLRQACREADLRAAVPTYVRYKPGTSCIAGFRLDVGGTPVDAYARAHQPGETEKLSKLVRASAATTPLGRPVVQLDGCATTVSFFPNDAELPSLCLLANPSQLAAMSSKLLPAAVGLVAGSGTNVSPRVAPLAYKPERRFVGKLEVAGEPVAVLKFYTETGYAAAERNAKMVRPRGGFRVPRRLGRSERHGVVALEWLPGRPLSELLADPATRPGLEVLTRLGAGLAAFASKGSARFRHRPDGAAGGAAAVLAVAQTVRRLWPPLADRAAELATRVVERLAADPGRNHPVHGDFYAKQVLLDGEALAVVDWDEAGLGEPASDLGNFIAHLERDALARRLSADLVEPAGDALRTGFEAAAGKSVAERVSVHAAAQLLRMATHPFRGREPDWAARIEVILDRVEQLLGSNGSTGTRVHSDPPVSFSVARALAVPVVDPFGIARDSAIPFARDALDPVTARASVVRKLVDAGFPDLLELRGIRITRHKPGRRFVAEYTLSDPRSPPDGASLTVLGKVRAKGADARTHDLARALWSAGFDGESTDGISVPRPIGIVPELGMTLQLKVAGEPATRVLARGGAAGVALASRLADVAHKLRQAGVPTTRSHGVADELRILHDRLGDVGAACPEWAGAVERLLARCDELATRIKPTIPVGIHRDYYPDQVLVDGTRLYLLDLDLYCLGDPELDIGNCVAHLTEQALRTSGDPDAWADRERAIETRFLELAGTASRDRVRAYAALSLARHVFISTRFADRRPLTPILLELSRRRIEALDRLGG